MELHGIEEISDPILMGWVNYYGALYPSHLRKALRSFDDNVLALIGQKEIQEAQQHAKSLNVDPVYYEKDTGKYSPIGIN